MKKSIYQYDIDELRETSGAKIEVVETDIDLYYQMALSLYSTIQTQNALGRTTTCILPVGPVFQYRRFIRLLERWPLDLTHVHFFFMDEYIQPDGSSIIPQNSLSFKGFIQRELINPMPGNFGFKVDQVYFPDPKHPQEYDERIEGLGGIDLCHAGIGIVGHLAFNEPQDQTVISCEAFRKLPTRVVDLTRETITINSNTALRGAYELIPEQAVTIGMKQILSARSLEIYCNRPWQSAVIRKALLLDPTHEFPVTLVRNHSCVSYTITEQVAEKPVFELR